MNIFMIRISINKINYENKKDITFILLDFRSNLYDNNYAMTIMREKIKIVILS